MCRRVLSDKILDLYLDVLRSEFAWSEAPDGTRVLSTPYEYVTGANIEVAMWEEDDALWISDRGGLMQALYYELGEDVFEEYVDVQAALLDSIADGVEFLGNTFLMETSVESLGVDLFVLVKALQALQVQAGYWAANWHNYLHEESYYHDD
mgnify:CR=1 FL=1